MNDKLRLLIDLNAGDTVEEKYLLKNSYKTLLMILKKIDVADVKTVLSGLCEKHNILVIISKKTVLFFDRSQKSLFPGKIVMIPKEKMRGYTFLHEKGEDYLQCVFGYNNINYNLKIKVLEVKTPKYQLNLENISISKNISDLFKDGKIDYRKLGEEEEGKSEAAVEKGRKDRRTKLFYIVLIFAIADLLFTFVLIYAFMRVRHLPKNN